MKAVGRFLLIIALMISIGAHWGVLQIAAWANMARVYSAEKGLVEGLKETFDGKHPCAMCKKITAHKEGDSQQNLPVTKVGSNELTKWLSLERTAWLPQPHWNEGEAVVHRAAPAPHFFRWDASPPVPPPKIAA